MEKMTEDDFNSLIQKNKVKINQDECEHSIVKIYQNGMHIDYGCTKCGATHTDYDALKNHKSN